MALTVLGAVGAGVGVTAVVEIDGIVVVSLTNSSPVKESGPAEPAGSRKISPSAWAEPASVVGVARKASVLTSRVPSPSGFGPAHLLRRSHSSRPPRGRHTITSHTSSVETAMPSRKGRMSGSSAVDRQLRRDQFAVHRLEGCDAHVIAVLGEELRRHDDRELVLGVEVGSQVRVEEERLGVVDP